MTESINFEMVDELRELMEDDFPELIEIFLDDSDNRVSALKQAIEQSDATAIRDEAHGLKGSCSNLGADKLSDISFELETMGRLEQLLEIDEAFQRLINEHKLVDDYFKSQL